MIRIAAATIGIVLGSSGAWAQELTVEERYRACVLGTAAVHLRLAQEAGDPSIAADGSMFTPEIFVERAWTDCEALKPSPEANEDPDLQDFVLTALMNMFFCKEF